MSNTSSLLPARMQRRHAAAGFGLLLLLAGAAYGIYRVSRPAPAAATGDVVLLVSGDTAGWTVPCGCASNQSGGMPRRGTLVDDMRRRATVIVLDAGGAPGGDSPYHRVKFEWILRGELAMGVAAHNLGGPEAALGAEYLREIAASLKAPLLSANLRDAAGQLIAEPVRYVEAEGQRVGIIGVLSRNFAPKGMTVDDPRATLLQMLPELRRRADHVVVLAYVPEDELKQLAAALPEADAVLGGPTGQALPPQLIGPTLFGSATNKGKFLIEVTIRASKQRAPWTGRVIELDPKFADHAGQTANVSRYLDELEQRDFAAYETGFVPPRPAALPKEYRLAGNQACASCHQQDCAAWDGSKHAHAWDTLVAKGFQRDSYCQQCHTTGFGAPGGFESPKRTNGMRNVGCESCHGPSLAHALKPKTRTSFAARDQCGQCHDRENSPNFDFARYWVAITHGDVGTSNRKNEVRP